MQVSRLLAQNVAFTSKQACCLHKSDLLRQYYFMEPLCNKTVLKRTSFKQFHFSFTSSSRKNTKMLV